MNVRDRVAKREEEKKKKRERNSPGKIYGCQRWRWKMMKADDPLWRPLQGAAERRSALQQM